MRQFVVLAPLCAALALAAATPSMALEPTVSVTIGGDLVEEAEKLGEREVQEQADRLAQVVTRTLDRRGALDGAQINLVLTDVRPNRPTFQQMTDQPGLDGMRSISIGGAAIEGEIVTAAGERIPVSYDWYTSSLAEVTGFTTWQDAERAFSRLAVNLAEGRYVR